MRKEHALIPLLSPEDKPDKKIKEPTFETNGLDAAEPMPECSTILLPSWVVILLLI